MSIPPQLIRVKRKRVVEETPVTFLQFDGIQKRVRSGTWAYQRRDPTAAPTPKVLSDKPVIHVSRPEDASPPTKKHHGAQLSLDSSVSRPSLQPTQSGSAEPRRFHVSRSALAASRSQTPKASGVSKKDRYTPAIFVERSRQKKTPKPRRSFAALHAATQQLQDQPQKDAPVPANAAEERPLKRPGTTKKIRDRDPQKEAPVRAPLPTSLMNRHNEDMDKIAMDMNRWALNEIGANLHSMEQEKQQSNMAKFKPKAPIMRYQERHPELALHPQTDEPVDVPMGNSTEDEDDGDDDDEWIIEEYVRIPANTVALDVSPADIGVLVLDDEEEKKLFFGPTADEEDDLDEDDEDENAENHYTADYPEDEVESDDEYGRQPYGYRNGNASDDEEFGNVHYSDDDDDQDERLFRGEAENDDDPDARIARIRAYMKRNSAFQ